MILAFLITLLIIFILIGALVVVFAYNCFDDNDDDMYWHDSQR